MVFILGTVMGHGLRCPTFCVAHVIEHMHQTWYTSWCIYPLGRWSYHGMQLYTVTATQANQHQTLDAQHCGCTFTSPHVHTSRRYNRHHTCNSSVANSDRRSLCWLLYLTSRQRATHQAIRAKHNKHDPRHYMPTINRIRDSPSSTYCGSL